MHIFIDNRSGVPIYEQIAERIKAAILSGEAAPDEALPSIRALAKDLRISVITTKRAYEELERDGYVHSVAGKGFYVAPKDADIVREDCLRRIEGQMEQMLSLARTCGVTADELVDMLRTLDKEGNL